MAIIPAMRIQRSLRGLSIGSVLAALLLFSVQSARACDSWTFSDTESDRKVRFLENTLKVIAKDKVDPTFMYTKDERAFFTNGDRIRFTPGGNVELQTFLGVDKNKKRSFRQSIIGSYKGLSATLPGYGSIEVKLQKSDTASTITVEKEGKRIGRGSYPASCIENTSPEYQAQRVLSYYVWSSRLNDPFKDPIDNWWW